MVYKILKFIALLVFVGFVVFAFFLNKTPDVTEKPNGSGTEEKGGLSYGGDTGVKNIGDENKQCSQNRFKFAFVLLGKNQDNITQVNIDKLTDIKNKFQNAFAYATNNLASADTTYPVKTIVDDGRLMNPEKTEFFRDWIAKKFLESNPDDFDFIIAFMVPSGGAMDSFTVDYDIYGIGKDESTDYTSLLEKERGFKQGEVKTNKLKSVVYWASPELESRESDSFLNGILHEAGHHWCCYVGDNFAKGKNNAKLEIIQEGMHFYWGLESPYNTGDSMNSNNWVPNGDGSYRRENKEGLKKYHPFQLYFMGLLNDKNYDFNKKFKVYNAGIGVQDLNEQMAYPYKEVSINDIIAVEGIRRCR